MVGTIDLLGFCFDLVLSEVYNKIIISEGYYLDIYDRPISAETFSSEMLFQVRVANDLEIHCMKLVKERGSEYIYMSTEQNYILKIKVSEIMKMHNNPGKLQICWKSTFELSIPRGLDICMGKVYVTQFSATSLKVLDCEDGQSIEENGLPEPYEGYGIHLLSECEMLIIEIDGLRLYEKQQDGKWTSTRKRNFQRSLNSIFYEKSTQLIYISENNINIMRLEDFSLVKQTESRYNSYEGMIVDSKSGLFYVCNLKSVFIYQ